ncbi:transketolase C-terminal domain-containing protein [Neomoorella thermoacetica]|uniref:transketolase C-terminal domain-containing protein n=1 Tax=Neomoorella thermoacetica TaxID=1525 RepID=UPI0008FAF49F|nr:transketolase C-terminal domain-containing protein [Moorella thermoacetica]APC07469.1 pyruvate synthase subunit PorA [Moorella thermoacetica]
MATRKLLDGNGAAAEAMRMARVQVISAYPITPQSPIAEKLAEYVANGTLKAKYVRVESEHTAMSVAIGAQLTGVRACTATSSVGLALMHEMLGVASGCRVPIVMAVINRSLVSPWSLWCDHQDSMAERDSGWIQLYVENPQEVLDTMFMAYRLAEDPRVLLPVMVCLDGFFLSHTPAALIVPDQETVDSFLPPYRPSNLYLDPDDPMFINDLTPSSDFTEMRYQQKQAFDQVLQVLSEIQDEFARVFGRQYSMVEAYRCEDAEVVLVTLGSMSGTAKYVVNELRKKGQKVGVLKIICFRPFPAKLIREALKHVPVVGVMDRSAGLGAEGGPVWTEISAALGCLRQGPQVISFIGGLGGRDLAPHIMEKAFEELLAIKRGIKTYQGSCWIDVRDDALRLREVSQGV